MDTADVSTPGTTTETSSAPAAPATEAPSSSSTPSQRPTSMLAAFEQVAAARQTPVAATEETAAIAPPATTDPTGVTPQGPIPFAAHKTALDNARTKERQAVTAEFDQQYGWARQVPQQTLRDFSQIANQMTGNPAQFLETYFQEAANHPQHGQAVRSWAARTLASRSPQQQAPAVDLTPDVQVTDANGTVIESTFSGKRVMALIKQVVEEATGPLKQAESQRQTEHRARVAQQQQAVIAQQLDTAVDTTLADLSELLDLTAETPAATKDALFAEINALLEQDASMTPHRAAMQVRKTRIVPGLKASATRDALDTIHKKAAGNTAGSGGSGTPLTRPKNVKQLQAWMAARER